MASRGQQRPVYPRPGYKLCGARLSRDSGSIRIEESGSHLFPDARHSLFKGPGCRAGWWRRPPPLSQYVGVKLGRLEVYPEVLNSASGRFFKVRAPSPYPGGGGSGGCPGWSLPWNIEGFGPPSGGQKLYHKGSTKPF